MKAYCVVIILSFVLGYVICESSQSYTVNIAQGPVRGYEYGNDQNMYVFYGIPYAKAPTGDDRFKAPLPPPVWSEPFEAVNDSIACPQIDFGKLIRTWNKNYQEDCLVANIYMPITNKNKLPVVVVFHGGVFSVGSGTIDTESYLLRSKEVVVVTFNFRMGAHGFLCLGTKFAPGNAGMKDQVALLRWVNKNIASFGGDPHNVILSGYNTGSSSIGLITMSKITKGLFKRVILESGAAIAPFSVQFNPIINAQKLAEMLQFENVENFDELQNFYKNISYETLNSKPTSARPDSTFLMSPCVERDLGEEMFLEDHPINILKNGDFARVPITTGFVETEGQFRLPLFDYWKFWMNIRFLEFLPADLQFENDEEKEEVAEEIKMFYFGNKEINEHTTSEFVDYFTDVMFAYPILREVRLRVGAGQNQIYLYRISKSLTNSPSKIFANVTFSNECSKSLSTFDDYWEKNQNEILDKKEIEDTLQDSEQLFLNFIIKGEPVPPEFPLTPWPPVKANLSPHMYVSNSLKLKGSLLKKKVHFWDKIYKKYHRIPSAPTPPQEKS